MSIKKRIDEMLSEDERLFIWFGLLCETGPERLRAQTWQFHDELAYRNLKHKAGRLAFTPAKVEDALLELAVELLPETSAGACDPREVLFKEAVAWLMEHCPQYSAEFTEGLDEVWANGTLSEFREELRGRMKAAAREVAA